MRPVDSNPITSQLVDSTATLQRLGDSAWQDLLRAHDSRMRENLATFHGREVKTTGDGFLATFNGATNAARCAVAMTRSAHQLGLAIRVGLNTGEVEFVADDVRGVAVHTAERVMSWAGADEILISATTSDLLEGSGIPLAEAGTHELKGLTGPRQLFRVTAP